MSRLLPVDIDGVTNSKCSVVGVNPMNGERPVILVHGILDNVWRWITQKEATERELSIPDFRKPVPLFDPSAENGLAIPKVFDEVGLISSLEQASIPVAAFSYQDGVEPVATMTKALEKLHRVVNSICNSWGANSVDLVAHSRGGLVCRHALTRDSAALSATEFTAKIHSLTTLCTPHLGSRLAEYANAIYSTISRVKNLSAFWPERLRIQWPLADNFNLMVANVSQLSPSSDEVVRASSALMPSLPGGYFAIAGNVPHYFRVGIAQLGTIRMPPALPIPELTDGQGDSCVSVESAFDIPSEGRTKVQQFAVNHLTACMHRDVHAAIIDWLKNS